MKRLDLAKSSPTLRQVLELANEEDIVLETKEGRRFALVELDDFDDEIAAVVRNRSLMKLLEKRSRETAAVPLGVVRSRLDSKKNGQAKTRKSKPG